MYLRNFFLNESGRNHWIIAVQSSIFSNFTVGPSYSSIRIKNLSTQQLPRDSITGIFQIQVSNVFFREFAIYEKVSGNKRLGFSQSVQKLKKVSPPIAADFLFGRDWNMPMTHIGKRSRPVRRGENCPLPCNRSATWGRDLI